MIEPVPFPSVRISPTWRSRPDGASTAQIGTVRSDPLATYMYRGEVGVGVAMLATHSVGDELEDVVSGSSVGSDPVTGDVEVTIAQRPTASRSSAATMIVQRCRMDSLP